MQLRCEVTGALAGTDRCRCVCCCYQRCSPPLPSSLGKRKAAHGGSTLYLPKRGRWVENEYDDTASFKGFDGSELRHDYAVSMERNEDDYKPAEEEEDWEYIPRGREDSVEVGFDSIESPEIRDSVEAAPLPLVIKEEEGIEFEGFDGISDTREDDVDLGKQNEDDWPAEPWEEDVRCEEEESDEVGFDSMEAGEIRDSVEAAPLARPLVIIDDDDEEESVKVGFDSIESPEISDSAEAAPLAPPLVIIDDDEEEAVEEGIQFEAGQDAENEDDWPPMQVIVRSGNNVIRYESLAKCPNMFRDMFAEKCAEKCPLFIRPSPKV